MRKKDINKHFTDIVKEYMDKGFIVNAQSMCSILSGEICKVDLTDGNGVCRFLLRETNEIYDDDDSDIYVHVRGIRLTVHYFAGRKPHTRNVSLWEDEGEVIREENFYKMTSRSSHKGNHNEWFTTDFDAVVSAERVHRTRCDTKRTFYSFGDFYEYPESAKRNLLPLIRRLPKCKTAHLEDIGNVWRVRETDGENIVYIFVKGKRHMVYLGRRKSA